VQGAVYEIGGSRNEFSIQSVSKPFALARAFDAAGRDAVQKRIGVNATGWGRFSMLLSSIARIELKG
jgi:glutaminase